MKIDYRNEKYSSIAGDLNPLLLKIKDLNP